MICYSAEINSYKPTNEDVVLHERTNLIEKKVGKLNPPNYPSQCFVSALMFSDYDLRRLI